MVTHRKTQCGFPRPLAPVRRALYDDLMMRSALLCLLLGACIQDTRRAGDAADAPDTSADTGEDVALDTSDAESCSEPGMTRCADGANATEICLGGTWQRASCAEGKICVVAGGAQCVDSTGDADCRDTFYCFLGCQILHGDDLTAGEACLLECFRGATREDQVELSEALGCFEKNCTQDAAFDCVAEHCSQDLADCYFDTNGDASCGTIIECRLACGDDAACGRTCGSDATVQAQGDYAVLELCTFYACAGQDADCARRESLPTGACAAYTNECVGLLPSTDR
jgi:hypothetical protein